MSSILVAYFSATGVTRRVAEVIAESVKGDLFAIKPTRSYSAADLDWNDKESRSTHEMNDDAARPEIESKVANMEKYSTIFLGFPIWWYMPPRIINTFLESYNFADKIMIPFATSGGSGLGRIPQVLAHICPEAHWLPGIRFAASSDKNEIAGWAAKTIEQADQ